MTIALLDISLPFENPVLKFLIILLIILCTPILLNKIKIPNLLGLILAGAVIGPNGLNLMERDSGIILSGTAGLLYIMFLAGLEIDLADFKKNTKKSLVFGMFTFSIPMILGIFTGLYIFEFSVLTSVLLASMFASHTLIAYPLVSKLGVARNRAVNITVGGTMITDILALLVLAVIVGMTKGEVGTAFWLKLSISVLVFSAIVMFLFPIIARWFFKTYDDYVSQYIFVLALVFFGAILAEIAGIEAIIGAFLTGLALNRLIPRTSPLMNRVEFVGNAIFIPFFLIGIGMLIDFRVFFQGWEAIWIAAVMTIVATSAKFLAAWLTQKIYRFSVDERRLIFGLSNAQAAATLAAVMIGYNIILGTTEGGEPIRLLNENVLNGTILMILVTCTVASFVAQKGARNLALSEVGMSTGATVGENDNSEKILIPVNNTETLDELIHLGLTIKSAKNSKGLYALTIIDNNSANPGVERKAREVMHRAAVTASATDNYLQELLRYDLSVMNGITGAVKENGITDLIIGLHVKQGISDSYLSELTERILTRCNTTTFIYKPAQPLATIKKHIVVIPENAEKEIGFPFWISKLWNIAENSGAELVFYATASSIILIKKIQVSHAVECSFHQYVGWDNFGELFKYVGKNDNLIIVLSRKNKISYQYNMLEIPSYLNNQFKNNSFILIYPMQEVY
ncbi:cation:proton antiporter [Salegentibacter sp. F188]|uniref:Cation:proton antiporter n=1 Tax=Autumnicola patrickiae TaxID=3075591 RepID=A0ABU3E6A6_9FLAO|nr:cation:proton antiporter [Salegentibacter sp. F188]MDT0691526.1 cation:proton antiporter [Salegentibacter sp. F188]